MALFCAWVISGGRPAVVGSFLPGNHLPSSFTLVQCFWTARPDGRCPPMVFNCPAVKSFLLFPNSSQHVFPRCFSMQLITFSNAIALATSIGGSLPLGVLAGPKAMWTTLHVITKELKLKVFLTPSCWVCCYGMRSTWWVEGGWCGGYLSFYLQFLPAWAQTHPTLGLPSPLSLHPLGLFHLLPTPLTHPYHLLPLVSSISYPCISLKHC